MLHSKLFIVVLDTCFWSNIFTILFYFLQLVPAVTCHLAYEISSAEPRVRPTAKLQSLGVDKQTFSCRDTISIFVIFFVSNLQGKPSIACKTASK